MEHRMPLRPKLVGSDCSGWLLLSSLSLLLGIHLVSCPSLVLRSLCTQVAGRKEAEETGDGQTSSDRASPASQSTLLLSTHERKRDEGHQPGLPQETGLWVGYSCCLGRRGKEKKKKDTHLKMS